MKRKSAFTLLEVLLTVTIGSVILLSLYTTWATGIRLGRGHDRSNALLHEVHWTFDQIEKDLGRMSDYDFSGSYPEKRAFTLFNNSLIFIITGEDGLKAVRYALETPSRDKEEGTKIGQTFKKNVKTTVHWKEESAPGQVLIRQEKDFGPFLVDGFKEEDPREILLEELDPQDFRLTCAIVKEKGKSPAWEDSWIEGGFPTSVRVELNMKTLVSFQLPARWSRDFFLAKGFAIADESQNP